MNSLCYQLLLPQIFLLLPFPLNKPPLQLQPASLHLRVKSLIAASCCYIQHTGTTTNGPWSSHSSRHKLFRYSKAADTCSIAPSYACHWLNHAATTLPPIDNTAYSPPNGHRHLTTHTCSNMPKDYTR